MNVQHDPNQVMMVPMNVLPSGQMQVPPVTTSIVIHQEMKKHPVVLACPYCLQTVKSAVKKKSPCWDFCCKFCCGALMNCSEREHTCPECKKYLGTY